MSTSSCRTPAPAASGDIFPTWQRGPWMLIHGSVPRVLLVISPLRGKGTDVPSARFMLLGLTPPGYKNAAAARWGDHPVLPIAANWTLQDCFSGNKWAAPKCVAAIL